ncbi:MAG: hypothetical protein R3C15_06555 [Thermoleophilia bacterium]
MPVDRGRRDAQVGDADAGRGDPGEQRALDEPAGAGRGAARDDPRAALERRAERHPDPDRDLGRQVDVDEPGDALLAEDGRRRAGLPDQVPVDLRAGLDLLERVDPNAREDGALLAEDALVPDRGALLDAHVRADVARLPDDGALDRGAAADRRRRVDDRPHDRRPVADRHAAREHRVRADRGGRGDRAVVADERGAGDAVERVELHARADPDVPAQPDPGDVEPDLPVERVEVRLAVLVEVPHVLPVARQHVPVDRSAHLEQEGEQVLREVERAIGRHVAQHLGLDDVDPGVDRVREDLPPARLLEEPLDPAVLVRDDDPELERVVDALQADRHRSASRAMRRHERAEVDVADRVARDDEERLVELVLGELDRAGGAGRGLLDRVADPHAVRLAGPEVAADRLRHERQRDDHVVEPVVAQELDDVLHARPPDDRDHRLGLVRRQRPQAGPLAPGHDDGLHRRLRSTAAT